MEVLKNSVSKLFADWEEIKKGGRKAYLRKSDLGHDDGVHRAGSVPERLAGVTVRMVLVLVDLTVLIVGVPGHGALVDADVALGVDRGGLAAEVPITGGEKPAISLCILFWYVESWRQVLASNWEILFAVVGKAKKEGEYSPSSNQESTGHNTEEDLEPIRQELDHTQEHSSSVIQRAVRRAQGHAWGPSRGRPPPSWRHCRIGAEEHGGETGGQKPGGRP